MNAAYQTYDSESRLLSMGITNGASPVTWFDYLWDVGGNILAITNNGNNIVLYGYDRAGQLTNEIYFTNGIAGGTTNSWVYDEAGNWRNASSTRKWLYNADNEMIAKVPSATPDAPSGVSATVTGEVEPGPNSNKWYNTWAECKEVQAQVSTTDGSFSLASVALAFTVRVTPWFGAGCMRFLSLVLICATSLLAGLRGSWGNRAGLCHPGKARRVGLPQVHHVYMTPGNGCSVGMA